MKKVLIFIESLAGGGAEKALVNLVKALDKEKYDITVMTVTDNDIYQEAVMSECRYMSFVSVLDSQKGGISKLQYWMRLKYIYNAPAASVYRKYIHDKYDIEIAFVEGFATKLISASTNQSSKKVAWIHTDVRNNPYADKCFSSLEDQIGCYQRYSRIICVSESVKKAFEEKLHSGTKNIVLYNPIDENEIQRLADSGDFNRPECLLLGTVGRIEQQKGYMRLLSCVDRLHKEFDFELWIVGDGSQKKDLEQYIDSHHLQNVVKLLGYQRNPYAFMKLFDAFVCSSYAEGYSTVAVESILLNVPVLTVDCSGMKEVCGGYKCGEIVENTDAALYDMLYKAVSGMIDLKQYKEDLKIRAAEMNMISRVAEIEEMLDEL